MWPLVQNLWRCPSRGIIGLIWGLPDGFRALSDRSETKICNSCMARLVHKDVWLTGCQCGGTRSSRATAYPLEVSMNDITGMEVAESLDNIGELVTGISVV
jgi:hypothetical protein